MITNGCGKPEHVGHQSAEGTAYCETCRTLAAEARVKALEALLDSGAYCLNADHKISITTGRRLWYPSLTIRLPADAINWRDGVKGGGS